MRHDNERLLRIADIGFHVRWAHPKASIFRDPCYNGFRFRLKPDIDKARRSLRHKTLIDVSYRPGDIVPRSGRVKKVFEIPRHWTLYAADSGYYLERFHPRTNRRISLSIISKDLAVVKYHPANKRSWSIRYMIQPLIKYMLVNILAKNEGVMMHGAAIKIGAPDGRVFIFSGRSGSGKTTISKLFRDAGMTVLTDETIVIRRHDGRFYAYGTPWPGGGRMAAAESAPVGAICFISHGTENALRKADRKQAAKNILYQTVVQAWDPAAVGCICDSAVAAASDIPCFDMPFVDDRDVVPFVMKNLVIQKKEAV